MRPDTNKLVLMDNNILASEYGISQLESMIGSGYAIDLNQGMDARLVDDRIAGILARLTWIRFIRFSCDQIPQIEAIERAAELLHTSGLSLETVAQAVGYSSVSQFAAAFRQQYGVTPGQYRKNV